MNTSLSPSSSKATAFLSIANQFKLGDLPTESRHPLTFSLSEHAEKNLSEALRVLSQVDAGIFPVLRSRLPLIMEMARDIRSTLAHGHRIFLCGCGATGRLSLVLENIWLQEKKTDQVVAFMAGGDTALIKSIEDFEDHPEFGHRQLLELGFGDGDLLIACTEGGETPFVIGATETAAKVSARSPYFLYCNPDDILIRHVERSKRVIENVRIRKINLTTGPMALSGSTRMQASTILMLAVGMALLNHADDVSDLERYIDILSSWWNGNISQFLVPFIEKESAAYRADERVFYEADPELGISILTDTTERSPTFSLMPFENAHDSNAPLSLCYLLFPHASDSSKAWSELLHRSPRALDWERYRNRVDLNRLLGHDFSQNALQRRTAKPHHRFSIVRRETAIEFRFGELEYVLRPPCDDLLGAHTVLKCLLNMHSTLVMGRLGRYESNVMVWVRPSNNKLVDRTIRYVDYLLHNEGIYLSYETICHECFRQMELAKEDEPVVRRVVEALRLSNTGHPGSL